MVSSVELFQGLGRAFRISERIERAVLEGRRPDGVAATPREWLGAYREIAELATGASLRLPARFLEDAGVASEAFSGYGHLTNEERLQPLRNFNRGLRAALAEHALAGNGTPRALDERRSQFLTPRHGAVGSSDFLLTIPDKWLGQGVLARVSSMWGLDRCINLFGEGPALDALAYGELFGLEDRVLAEGTEFLSQIHPALAECFVLLAQRELALLFPKVFGKIPLDQLRAQELLGPPDLAALRQWRQVLETKPTGVTGAQFLRSREEAARQPARQTIATLSGHVVEGVDITPRAEIVGTTWVGEIEVSDRFAVEVREGDRTSRTLHVGANPLVRIPLNDAGAMIVLDPRGARTAYRVERSQAHGAYEFVSDPSLLEGLVVTPGKMRAVGTDVLAPTRPAQSGLQKIPIPSGRGEPASLNPTFAANLKGNGGGVTITTDVGTRGLHGLDPKMGIALRRARMDRGGQVTPLVDMERINLAAHGFNDGDFIVVVGSQGPEGYTRVYGGGTISWTPWSPAGGVPTASPDPERPAAAVRQPLESVRRDEPLSEEGGSWGGDPTPVRKIQVMVPEDLGKRVKTTVSVEPQGTVYEIFVGPNEEVRVESYARAFTTQGWHKVAIGGAVRREVQVHDTRFGEMDRKRVRQRFYLSPEGRGSSAIVEPE